VRAKVGSLKYAAMKIGCSLPTLYDLIQGGKLRSYHIGRLSTGLERPLCGCAVERRRFPVGESPTRRDAPAGSNRSNCGGNETVEASGDQRVTIYGDVASVQAVTRVNAEQASKRTMHGPTRSCKRGRLIRLGEREQGDDLNRCAGVLASARTQGKARATREALWRGEDDQPVARESRPGVMGWRRGS